MVEKTGPNPIILRLKTLPAQFAETKRAFHARWGAARYSEYCSPWIPVTEDNLQYVKRGDLVINQLLLEEPYLEGRELEKVENGRIVEVVRLEANPPLFVWVDTTDPLSAQRFLEGNPFKNDYNQYSEAMRQMLAWATINRVELTKKLDFAVFHETDQPCADSILTNGIDMQILWGNRKPSVGSGFFAKNAAFAGFSRRSKNYGVSIEISAKEGANIVYFDINHLKSRTDLFGFWDGHPQFNRELIGQGKIPYWPIACAELGAHAIREQLYYIIYDDFCSYRYRFNGHIGPPPLGIGDGYI